MERRDFLKLASVTGLSVVGGSVVGNNEAAAEPSQYTGPLCLFVHAGGGWCPQDFCDPKGATVPIADMDQDEFQRRFHESEIVTSGNIRHTPDSGGIREFFEANYQELLVVNGVDTSTNSHDAGTRTTWAGSLTENKPALGALLAAVYGPALPMSFITNGGYDGTAGLVPVARMGNLNAIRRIAYPDVIDPNDEASERFRSELVRQKTQEARAARHEAFLARQRLPRIQREMSTLYASRLGSNELRRLTEFLPDQVENGMAGQGQLAIAAYRAGACVAANLSAGGFDTHGNHDNSQVNALNQYFNGVGSIIAQVKEAGIDAVIVMGSDFGRTPRYNSGDGKDHWSISSYMMWGKGIKGNRVIGATTLDVKALNVNPTTLALDESGVRITTGHVHKALRKLLGIAEHDILRQFPIAEPEELPLFG